MRLFPLPHRHQPVCTGRRIVANYGKPNLPDGRRPVVSTGWEAICRICRWPLIVHDPRHRFPNAYTELEDPHATDR